MASKLVISGPYGISRNPMYLSLLIISIAYAFFKGKLVFFLSPVLFFIIMNNILIPEEEKALKKTLGSKYISYSKKVRRWI